MRWELNRMGWNSGNSSNSRYCIVRIMEFAVGVLLNDACNNTLSLLHPSLFKSDSIKYGLNLMSRQTMSDFSQEKDYPASPSYFMGFSLLGLSISSL